jgi:hypothetical protein
MRSGEHAKFDLNIDPYKISLSKPNKNIFINKNVNIIINFIYSGGYISL